MTDFVIRALTPADLRDVAAVHVDAFPESALSNLGHEALRRYYEWLLVGPHQTTAIAAFQANRLAGFMFGGTFNGAMSGFLRRNRVFLAWRVATHPWLIASPILRERIARALSILRRRDGNHRDSRGNGTPTTAAFGILAIAVAPDCQGLGIGKAIMTSTEHAARAGGFDRMQLTVATENAQAIGFYIRSGWHKVLVDGVWKCVMNKSLA